MIPSIPLNDEPIGLLSVTFESERTCYVLTPSPSKLTVGRHGSCDIQIQHSSVSRDHFSITIIGESNGGYQFSLEDHGSFNKTKVNGEVVSKDFLKDGDIIQAGIVSFKFYSLVRP